jgi:hypothetical protein
LKSQNVGETNNQSGAETAGRGGHGGRVFRWVWIAGLILVFYVLSSAPAAKLCDEGVMNPTWLAGIYSPLELLMDNCEPAERFFDWYFGIWGVK